MTCLYHFLCQINFYDSYVTYFNLENVLYFWTKLKNSGHSVAGKRQLYYRRLVVCTLFGTRARQVTLTQKHNGIKSILKSHLNFCISLVSQDFFLVCIRNVKCYIMLINQILKVLKFYFQIQLLWKSDPTVNSFNPSTPPFHRCT